MLSDLQPTVSCQQLVCLEARGKKWDVFKNMTDLRQWERALIKRLWPFSAQVKNHIYILLSEFSFFTEMPHWFQFLAQYFWIITGISVLTLISGRLIISHIALSALC